MVYTRSLRFIKVLVRITNPKVSLNGSFSYFSFNLHCFYGRTSQCHVMKFLETHIGKYAQLDA